MGNIGELVSWVLRGRQKRAVAQALQRPMTATEMRTGALAWAPRLRLRDVWSVLGRFEERSLTLCLTPSLVTGRFYYWTELGCSVAERAFGEPLPPVNRSADWDRYAWVARGKVRRLVLLEVARDRLGQSQPKTASVIRRNLREERGLGLSATLRGLKELELAGLIESRVVEEGGHRRYELTETGRLIVKWLIRRVFDGCG